MNIKESLEKLFSLHTFGVKLGLDNIKLFLDHIGNPQLSLKAFHIAGSNGKGSTAAFVSSILQEFDYTVGLYTSPHFVRFNERILINNQQIPDSFVSEFVNSYNDFIDEHKLTFFEVTTAMAFKYFHEMKVDFAVIETGLGGRLDATNVLSPLAVILTAISLEHTNILGNTIEEITNEKAAIIKEGIKVFCGMLPLSSLKMIGKKCNSLNCELFRLDEYSNQKNNSLELYTEELEIDDWTTSVYGHFQKFNAALAVLAVSKTLGLNDSTVIARGIKNVAVNTNLQGRYEFINRKPDIIFDSAHNPQSVEVFLSEFKNHFYSYSNCTLLFTCMKDKNAREMLEKLKKYFKYIYLTEIKNERSNSIEDLIKITDELNISAESKMHPSEFVKSFFSKPEKDCLVVLGSMYLIGEIKSNLLKEIA